MDFIGLKQLSNGDPVPSHHMNGIKIDLDVLRERVETIVDPITLQLRDESAYLSPMNWILRG